jgi:hypothetical protein
VDLIVCLPEVFNRNIGATAIRKFRVRFAPAALTSILSLRERRDAKAPGEDNHARVNRALRSTTPGNATKIEHLLVFPTETNTAKGAKDMFGSLNGGLH